MTIARALCIGLNAVDPGAYAGWDGQLAACENDARDMAAIAAAQGYEAVPLLGAQATAAAVLAALQRAAREMTSGDHLLVTYSGHGGQLPDADGDEPDALDESWCLHDRMLLDDELFAAWARFRAGVRVLVVSDSCHSGSVVKAATPPSQGQPTPGHGAHAKRLPAANALAAYRQHRSLYDALKSSGGAGRELVVAARVLLLSGCQDDQLSMDGPRNGAFTSALLQVWDSGRFHGSHAAFHAAILERMQGGAQVPNFLAMGGRDAAFEAARPFTWRDRQATSRGDDGHLLSG